MAVLPHFLVREALAAPHHVQVAVASVTPPPSGELGATIVAGEVVRVFRGPLARGAPVRVAVHALREGESPPPSGILWCRLKDVVAARVIECWATEDEDGVLRVAGSQLSLLEAPSDEPAHPLDEADARDPHDALGGALARVGGARGARVLFFLCAVAMGVFMLLRAL